MLIKLIPVAEEESFVLSSSFPLTVGFRAENVFGRYAANDGILNGC